jgi:HK97 family phage prohead protease
MEAHAPGSFAKSIKEAARQLPLLMFHDSQSFPVGVAHEWRDGDAALGCVWRIDEKDDRAVEAARKAADGYLTGMSIGFAPIRTEWSTDDKGLDWALRRESRLLEVSLTPTPAFAGAHVTVVRSRGDIAAESQRRSAEVDAYKRELAAMRTQQAAFEGVANR